MAYARFPALGTGFVLMLLVLIGSLPYFRLSLPLFEFHHHATFPAGVMLRCWRPQAQLCFVTRYSLLANCSQPVG